MPHSNHPTRRQLLCGTATAALSASLLGRGAIAAEPTGGRSWKYGLVTYNWGKDLTLPELLQVCEQSGVAGLELRTTHKHGVEPTLSPSERSEVKKRFADSSVVFAGIGSDERFDSPDAVKLAAAKQATSDFILLSRDIGGSGVKVKPDRFWPGVPREKTIEQIGKSLNELAVFGAEHGQQIRLEVHGQCAELPTIRAILEIADHPNVGICWNCNPQDLQGDGLEHNFNLVKHRLGKTLHVHQYDHESVKYPYDELLKLLHGVKWDGWLMNETGGPIPPREKLAEALTKDRELFEAAAARVNG